MSQRCSRRAVYHDHAFWPQLLKSPFKILLCVKCHVIRTTKIVTNTTEDFKSTLRHLETSLFWSHSLKLLPYQPKNWSQESFKSWTDLRYCWDAVLNAFLHTLIPYDWFYNLMYCWYHIAWLIIMSLWLAVCIVYWLTCTQIEMCTDWHVLIFEQCHIETVIVTETETGTETGTETKTEIEIGTEIGIEIRRDTGTGADTEIEIEIETGTETGAVISIKSEKLNVGSLILSLSMACQMVTGNCRHLYQRKGQGEYILIMMENDVTQHHTV